MAMNVDEVGRKPWQRFFAEFLGTFLIVFAGCGAQISNSLSHGDITPLGICFTFGLTVMAMIYTLGPISAAHFNPAVTIAFAAIKRFPWRYVPAYIGSQVCGAVCASAMHWLLYGATAASKAQYGATLPAVPLASAFGFEVLLTFFLMLVVMAVATDRRVSGVVPGLSIGFTIVACALFGGPVTGASMNPVRSLAPALFAGSAAIKVLPIYIFGPIVGALLAGFCYEMLRDGASYAQGAPADLEEALNREPGLSRRR